VSPLAPSSACVTRLYPIRAQDPGDRWNDRRCVEADMCSPGCRFTLRWKFLCLILCPVCLILCPKRRSTSAIAQLSIAF
jgi:hypothetical protein